MRKSNIKNAWPELAKKDVQIEVGNGQENSPPGQDQPQLTVGSELKVRTLVKLAKVGPNDVSVELYYGPINAWGAITDGSSVKMDCKQPLDSEKNSECWFTGQVPCKASGRHGVAVRVLPRHTDLVNPYELGLVLWETIAAKN